MTRKERAKISRKELEKEQKKEKRRGEASSKWSKSKLLLRKALSSSQNRGDKSKRSQI